MTNPKNRKRVRKDSKPDRNKTGPVAGKAKPSPELSKLDRLISQLARPTGATMADLTAATGWQAHSVRGALAGSLKKKGHVITSEKIDGIRHYRIGVAK